MPLQDTGVFSRMGPGLPGGVTKLKLHSVPAVAGRGVSPQAGVFFFVEPLARYTAAWKPPPHPST